MTTITPADAVTLVRKNLDELDPNGSVMYDTDNNHGDNASLDETIKRMLPEAINDVHLSAPVQLLEGVTATIEEGAAIEDGILSFSLSAESKYIRLVAFRAADSNIVVTDTIPEASPEGRKQLNPYIRGRHDRPRLVILQGKQTGPHFKYYTISQDIEPSSAIALLEYVQEQFYASDAASYMISRRLRQNIIDCLTAKVMETYNDQRAQSFYQKANNYQ